MQSQESKAAQCEPEKPQEETAPADLRDPELDEEVACCIAEIDSVLAEAESEKDRAKREFSEIMKKRYGSKDELRAWSAKYAHLGLSVGYTCCGTPYLEEEE